MGWTHRMRMSRRLRVWTSVANVVFEHKIVIGAPDERFCAQLTQLSSSGWQAVGLAHGPDGLICLLRREKDFEVAQSLQVAFEESELLTEAISRREIPPEEMTR